MRNLQEDEDYYEEIRPSSDVSLPRNHDIKPPSHPFTLERILNYRVFGSKYEVNQFLILFLIVYLSYKIAMFFKYKIMNNIVTNMGLEALEIRNGRIYQYRDDLSHLDTQKILSLDVFELRKGLLNGDFTSVDLVNLFSDRCYRIGRGLHLTTQENFRTA